MIYRQRHPDDRSFIDAVQVFTKERWKSSGPGSQWRFSVVVELMRKGRVMFRGVFGTMPYAMAAAAAASLLPPLELVGDSVWETVTSDDPDLEIGTCCQPSCTKPSTVWYRMKREYDKSCSLSRQLGKDELWYREFCKAHAKRGDQGLDDGPKNYTKLAEAPEKPRAPEPEIDLDEFNRN